MQIFLLLSSNCDTWGGISPLMATSIVSGMFAGAMPPPLGSRDDHRVRQRGPARGGATSQWPLRERPALTHDKTIGIVETCEGGTTDLEAHTPSELLDPEAIVA